jgi:prophage antirepressor-like protein
MWDKFGVRVSKLGRICYRDLCVSILKISSDDEKYIDLLDNGDKYYINKKLYIETKAVVKLFMNVHNRSTINFCYDFLEKIMKDSNMNDTIILSKKKIYKYGDHKIMYFEIDGVKWYKGKDVCVSIGYSNSKDCLIKRVKDDCKISFCDLVKKSCANNIFLFHKEFIDIQTKFIDDNGLEELLLSSNKPKSVVLAKNFGINVKQKIIRKEIDVGCELVLFCKSASIKLVHQKTFYNKKQRYLVDYYLPDHKIAIEIDEYEHKDRDVKYEKNREKYLTEEMECIFVRCNPDDPNFTISGLIGRIHKAIVDLS